MDREVAVLAADHFVGAMVLVLRGSVTQLVIGTVFCLAFTMLQTQAGPFELSGDDYLAIGGEVRCFVSATLWRTRKNSFSSPQHYRRAGITAS